MLEFFILDATLVFLIQLDSNLPCIKFWLYFHHLLISLEKYKNSQKHLWLFLEKNITKIRVVLSISPSFLVFILRIILIEDKPLEKSEILHDLMLLQKIYFYLSMNIWITCKLFPLWQKMLDNCGTLLNREFILQ